MHLKPFHFFRWIFLLSSGFGFVACSDCEPLDTPGNLLKIHFFNKENFEADSTFVEQPINVTITTSNAVTLVADSVSQSTFLLPLPIEDEQLSLFLDYPDTLFKTYTLDGVEITDTIPNRENDLVNIKFRKYFEPVSPDCGIVVRYRDLEITNSSLDTSATVVFDFIEDNDSTNIRIFF